MPAKKKIDDMLAWKIFMAVANFGSMNKAAKKLGMDVSSVSRRIDALESQLGYALFSREARACELTIDGQHVIKEIAPVLLQLTAVLEGLLDDADHVQGKVKISVPDSLTEYFLRWMAEFQDQYPQLMVEVGVCNGACAELLGKEYDLVVGMEYDKLSLGKIFDLGPIPSYICATPAYIEKNGTLKDIEDFKDHRVLINSTWMCPSLIYDPLTKGALAHETGRRFRVTSMTVLKEATMAGIGVAIGLPASLCDTEITEGKLVRLMTPMEGLSLHFYGAVLNQEVTPPRLVKLMQWIQHCWQREFGNYQDPAGRCCALGLKSGFDF